MVTICIKTEPTELSETAMKSLIDIKSMRIDKITSKSTPMKRCLMVRALNISGRELVIIIESTQFIAELSDETFNFTMIGTASLKN